MSLIVYSPVSVWKETLEIKKLDWRNGGHLLSPKGLEQFRRFGHWLALLVLPLLNEEGGEGCRGQRQIYPNLSWGLE